MGIVCRCGYEHTDKSKLVMKRDPIFNKVRPICARCGHRVHIKTVNPADYKRMMTGASRG